MGLEADELDRIAELFFNVDQFIIGVMNKSGEEVVFDPYHQQATSIRVVDSLTGRPLGMHDNPPSGESAKFEIYVPWERTYYPIDKKSAIKNYLRLAAVSAPPSNGRGGNK